MLHTLSNRDKAIITGLYLSKFSKSALTEMDFRTYVEAYNTFGHALSIAPNSIYNYRCEFHPSFPNGRKGRNRAIREYCEIILKEYGDLNLLDFTDLVKRIYLEDYDFERLIDKSPQDFSNKSIAKRLSTGLAAEGYFLEKYSKIPQFREHQLEDTTKLACGFDYYLNYEDNFYCVEVKGLNTESGSIMLTEKEYTVANHFRDRYCLFIVSNFLKNPTHQLYFDPLHSGLSFEEERKHVVQTTYNANV